MFSRRAAGTRARYVDILNPSGAKTGGAVPAPLDLFAPLAPMPIPANLFVPASVPEEQQPMEGRGAEEQAPSANQAIPETAAEPPYLNSTTLPAACELPPSNPDGFQSGEPLASVPPPGGPPAGAIQFYNPSQFAQTPTATGSSRLGRIGQRKYPTLQ
uniref:Uncharacterized protein n=1 Tax=Sphenodon punctatus TaxID=8508 RepID=A0A8D0HS16_SPHPU